MKANALIVNIKDEAETPALPIRILYGTTTGNSGILAEEIAEKIAGMGLAYKLSSTKFLNPDELYEVETLLLIMSTDGDGEPPLMADDFYRFLNEKTDADLDHLSYSVLALGDSYYPDFCQAGKDFDRMLKGLGAQRIADRVDCDEHYWSDAEGWIENVCSVIEQKERQTMPTVQN